LYRPRQRELGHVHERKRGKVREIKVSTRRFGDKPDLERRDLFGAADERPIAPQCHDRVRRVVTIERIGLVVRHELARKGIGNRAIALRRVQNIRYRPVVTERRLDRAR